MLFCEQNGSRVNPGHLQVGQEKTLENLSQCIRCDIPVTPWELHSMTPINQNRRRSNPPEQNSYSRSDMAWHCQCLVIATHVFTCCKQLRESAPKHPGLWWQREHNQYLTEELDMYRSVLTLPALLHWGLRWWSLVSWEQSLRIWWSAGNMASPFQAYLFSLNRALIFSKAARETDFLPRYCYKLSLVMQRFWKYSSLVLNG